MNNIVYPVKKNEELDLRVEKLAFGGQGISRFNEYVIFIDRVLPGDLVRAKIYHRKKNYAQARVLQLIESSPLRQQAPCPYFGWCGGCTWQNLAYAEQLKVKQEHVKESLGKIGAVKQVQVLKALPSPQIWAYRNKMEFSFSDRRWLLPDELGREEIEKNFALGLHIPGTFDKIIDIRNCLLQSEAANQILRIIHTYTRQNNLLPYGLKSHSGYLRFLVIRQSLSKGHLMVNIVTFDRTPDKLKPLAAQLIEEVPGVRSVINTVNSKKAQIAVGDEEILLAGKDHIQDQIGSFQFNISAGSFFQTNTAQAARLYEVVMDYAGLSGKEIVWDLYAGTGTISLFLAQKARFVYAFELVDSAVTDGKNNARENNLSNIEFISGDLLNNLEHHQVPADVIVTDPPRSGMHSKVCAFLAGCAARRLIYVSCNPATMARDLEILQTGYRVVRVQPVDMFPHTYHIESVALLEKK